MSKTRRNSAKVCSKLNVPRFTDAEVAFLTEYVAVMKPVAQTLNSLQSETKMFMGYLLPTIMILKDKLQHKCTSAVVCKPLINALNSGIDRRFVDVFNDREVIAAAILHPKFRKTGAHNQAMIESGVQHIRYLLTSTSTATATSASATASSSASDDDDFFSTARRVPATSVDILSQYFNMQFDETNSICAWLELKELFIHLNTPLPASAASEHLFSCAGLTMSNRRTRMSDKLFEELVLLKQNKAL